MTAEESCCDMVLEDDCCTTSQIEQDGTFYDFVVNQSYKITTPATLITYIQLPSQIFSVETKSLYSDSKPPPTLINNQAVFQVFKC
ncbi:MAG: hypothetical protein HKP14_09810 [Bacteroidia bacterium]|nr:hypothetical protein [Bacteroidia bacterium]